MDSRSKPDFFVTYLSDVKENFTWFWAVDADIVKTSLHRLARATPAYLDDVMQTPIKLPSLPRPPSFGKLRLNQRAEKQIELFKTKHFSVSYSPFLATQGAVVLVCTLTFLFIAMSVFFPAPQAIKPPYRLIKTAITRQTSQAVAGRPVTYSALVKRSDITSTSYLLKLPKNAKNIRISAAPAGAAPSTNYQLLTTSYRKQLAGMFPLDLTGINFKQTQTAGLAEVRDLAVRFITAVNTFFLADLEEVAAEAIEQVVEQVNPRIKETDEAKIVDLSDEKAEKKEEKKEDKEEKKEQKQEEKEKKSTESSPAENIQPGEPTSPAEESAVSDTAQSEEPAEEEVETDESSGEVGVPPAEEVPAEDGLPPVVEVTGSADLFAASPEGEASLAPEEREEYVEVTYETEGPEITEQDTSKGKLVTVSDANLCTAAAASPQASGSNDVFSAESSGIQAGECPQLTDVLAYTTIPEIFKTTQTSLIKIKWTNEGGQEMPFTAYDLNNNGKLDYLEWTVPHLSDQTFEIIFISKAFLLDENREILEDIYEQVRSNEQTWQPGTYASVPQGNYVRVTFEKILTSSNDITIHMRPNPQNSPGLTAIIEVYPVYEDEQGNEIQGEKIAEFPAITEENTYKIYLTELSEPTDKFDLKVIRK